MSHENQSNSQPDIHPGFKGHVSEGQELTSFTGSPSYIGRVPAGQEMVLYDPMRANDTADVEAYITSLVPDNIANVSPINGHKIIAATRMFPNAGKIGPEQRAREIEVAAKTGGLEQVMNNENIVRLKAQKGNDMMVVRGALKDQYMGNVVNLVQKRRQMDGSTAGDNTYQHKGSINQSIRAKKDNDVPAVFNDPDHTRTEELTKPTLSDDKNDIYRGQDSRELSSNVDRDGGRLGSLGKLAVASQIKFTEVRLKRAEKRADKLEHRKEIRAEIARAGLEGRSPEPALRPTTPRENRFAAKVSRKVDKALQQSFEQTRIAKIFGAPKGTRGPLFERTVAPTTDAKRLGIRRSDIGTPAQEARLQSERLSRYEKKSERQSTKKWEKAGKRKNKHLDFFEARIEGRDFRSKIYDKRIKKARNTSERLKSTLADHKSN